MLSVQGQKLCSKCGHPGIFCRDRSCVDGLSAWCRECRGAKHRRWAALNPERCLANVQNYQANNRTLVTARTMAWQTENRDRHLTTRRTWAASNPEKILTHGRRYAAAHPEKLLERNARRRAALAGVPSTLTAHEWATRSFRVRLCVLPSHELAAHSGSRDPDQQGRWSHKRERGPRLRPL
jgi:hypothetical protein